MRWCDWPIKELGFVFWVHTSWSEFWLWCKCSSRRCIFCSLRMEGEYTSTNSLLTDLFTLKYRNRVHFFFFLCSNFRSIFISFPFHFVLSENNFNTGSRKNGECSLLCSGNTSPDNSVSRLHKRAKQKPILRQLEVMRLTHLPPKTQNWGYSGLENKQTTKHILKYLCLF